MLLLMPGSGVKKVNDDVIAFVAVGGFADDLAWSRRLHVALELCLVKPLPCT